MLEHLNPSAPDSNKAASVPTLLVWPGQSIAAAKLAAGISNDTDVVIAHVCDAQKGVQHGA